MTISIRECGHSVETSGRWHKAYSDRCYYCEYLQKYPRTVSGRADLSIPQRVARAESMKRVWKARKEKIVP